MLENGTPKCVFHILITECIKIHFLEMADINFSRQIQKKKNKAPNLSFLMIFHVLKIDLSFLFAMLWATHFNLVFLLADQ